MKLGVPRSSPPLVHAVTPERQALSPAAAIFLASFLGLFLELALIRWVSAEIRVFAYCKNLVLVATFLGFGAGCLLWRRAADLAWAMFLLLLLALLVRLPWPMLDQYGPRGVTKVLSEFSGFMIFRDSDTGMPGGIYAGLAFAVGWTTALFFLIALVMVPFGQITADGISRLGKPLHAYSINVVASLAGILAYTFVSSIHLPPLHWFVPVAFASALMTSSARERRAIAGVGAALVLVLLPIDRPNLREIWSSYQKLALVDGQQVVVNNIGYQGMVRQPVGPSSLITRFTMPYAFRTPVGRALVVGAGAGNDAAAALGAGVSSVTAVEIDPVIYGIGRELHPQLPYSDNRVHVVIDDARHFLKTTNEEFDVIVFSHLDSHTLLSSFTTVRLDNYIYTVESFREARKHLAPGGILYVSFYSELPFIGERLSRNLEEAFGYPPVALEQVASPQDGHWRNLFFVTGEEAVIPSLENATAPWARRFVRVSYRDRGILPSTDDWPFLPLKYRQIPEIMVLISAVILALSAAFAWMAKPPGETFDGRVFWLGAAFMLVEVHNVSRLALVFGTTWQVNAWVVGMILTVILLSNAVCLRLQRVAKRPGRAAVVGLFLSLGVAYLVPTESFLVGSRLFGGALATFFLTIPIFFAGLVFADAFARSSTPAFALGWNVLGAVTGGMAENVSYVVGIPGLLPLAMVFYAAALLRPLEARGTTGSKR